MDRELLKTFRELKRMMQKYEGPFTARLDQEGKYDLWSEREVLVAGRKRKEVFFASAIVQSDYVGFYYMPVYVARELKSVFKPELLRLLKGKSCFHLRRMDAELRRQVASALRAGYELYRERGWA
jgi:hypothetical protein